MVEERGGVCGIGVNETRLQRAVSAGAQNTGTALPSPRWLLVSALQQPPSLLSVGEE